MIVNPRDSNNLNKIKGGSSVLSLSTKTEEPAQDSGFALLDGPLREMVGEKDLDLLWNVVRNDPHWHDTFHSAKELEKEMRRLAKITNRLQELTKKRWLFS